MRPPCLQCRPLHFELAVPAALLLLCVESRAAEWTIVPSIGFRETFSDNIALAPSGQAKSDWVTELIPGVSVRAVGPRFRLSGNYGLHLLNYRRTGGSQALNNADFVADGELIKDLFFIDAAAAVTQQNISGFGAQSVDVVNTTGNLTEVRSLRLSPYLRRNFGDFAVGEARYTEQSTRATNGDLLNADAHRITLDLSSGPRFNRWGWDVLVDRQRIDYLNAFPIEFNRYTGKLRYEITPRIAAHLIAGHEDNTYPAIGGDRNGKVWAGALTWTPSETTIVAGSVGQRFFGRTFNVLASRRTQLSTFTLSYSEDVTTLGGIGSTGTFDTVRVLNALRAANAPVTQMQLPAVTVDPVEPQQSSGTAGTLPSPIGSQRSQRPVLAPGSDAAIEENRVRPPARVQPGENPTPDPRQKPNPDPAKPGDRTAADEAPERDVIAAPELPAAGSVARPAYAPQTGGAMPAAYGNPIAPFSPQVATAFGSTRAQQNLLDPFALNVGLPGGLTGLTYGLSNRVYLQKLLQATFELTGARNTFLARAFTTRREPLSVATLNTAPPPSSLPFQDDDSRQVGLNLSFTHHLSPRTNLNAGFNIARLHSYLDDRTDRDASVRIGVSRRLREKVSVSLEARRQQRNSSQSSADYRENAVLLFVLIQL